MSRDFVRCRASRGASAWCGLVRFGGVVSGGCDDEGARGDAFEALRLWQEAPRFMLVIVEGLHGGDAAYVARAEFFAQAERVGHQREEHSQVTEVTLWAESVVGSCPRGFDDERAREVGAGDHGVAAVEPNRGWLAALERVAAAGDGDSCEGAHGVSVGPRAEVVGREQVNRDVAAFEAVAGFVRGRELDLKVELEKRGDDLMESGRARS